MKYASVHMRPWICRTKLHTYLHTYMQLLLLLAGAVVAYLEFCCVCHTAWINTGATVVYQTHFSREFNVISLM